MATENNTVVICTDHSAKEPRSNDVDGVMTSGILGGVMVKTPVWNAIGVGLNHALDTIYPFCITHHAHIHPHPLQWCCDQDPVQAMR